MRDGCDGCCLTKSPSSASVLVTKSTPVTKRARCKKSEDMGFVLTRELMATLLQNAMQCKLLPLLQMFQLVPCIRRNHLETFVLEDNRVFFANAELQKLNGYSSAICGVTQTSTTATNLSPTSSLYKYVQDSFVKLIFKKNDLQKISGIYADWI
ncbi:hypothetical protein RIF29_25253 [Crotalaria pallida]|uniref:Uncharacterized protein n=1 Tax=Crotalaria pallida TaxID=3830 RepID=A0AAN9ELZ2_CROPI